MNSIFWNKISQVPLIEKTEWKTKISFTDIERVNKQIICEHAGLTKFDKFYIFSDRSPIEYFKIKQKREVTIRCNFWYLWVQS